MRVSETPLFTGAEMPGTGWVMVSLPINATEFRVHRIARDLIGATGPQGPIGPAGLTGSTGPAGPAGTGGVFLDEAANLVFAGPAAGGAVQPAFRSLVAADIPSLSATYLPLAGGTLTGSLTGTAVFVDSAFVVRRDGSDTIAIGPYVQLINNDDTASVLLQLNAAGGLDFWIYDGAVWNRLVNVSKDGLLTGTNAAFIGVVSALQVTLGVSAVTYAATTNIDFSLAAQRTLALTGDVTFTTSNLVAGKTVGVKILCDGSARTFTFPATWKFVGATPTGIAANKTGRLSIEAWGVTDADCMVAYSVEA